MPTEAPFRREPRLGAAGKRGRWGGVEGDEIFTDPDHGTCRILYVENVECCAQAALLPRAMRPHGGGPAPSGAERGAMPCPAMRLLQSCPPASAVPALSKEQGVATVSCDLYHWLACSFHHMFVCLSPSSLLITPHHLSLPLITPPSLITPYPLSSPLISPQPPSPPDRWRPTLTSTHGGTWWCSSLTGRLPPGVR